MNRRDEQMKNLKGNTELWVWIGIIAAVGIFILLMPTLDDFISGRRHDREAEKVINTHKNDSTSDKKDDKKENETTNYTYLDCTIPGTTENGKTTSYEFIIKFEKDGTLITSDVEKVIKYEDESVYKNVKETTVDIEARRDGFEQTKSFNDADKSFSTYVVYDHSVFDSNKNTSEIIFPTQSLKNRAEIDVYIRSKNYTCSKG